MLKKGLILTLFLFSFIPAFSQEKSPKNSEHISKFLKGNISDKTLAVREASGHDAIWLSSKAIEFTLENKAILGNDRDLDGLAVAAILSISPENITKSSELDKKEFEKQFIQLFNEFKSSNTVQIALLTKIVTLKESLSLKDFVTVLNNYLMTNTVQDIDSSVFKSALTAFESIGNSETFIILYNFLNNQKYSAYHKQLEKTISLLIPRFMDETLGLIQTATMNQLKSIFNLAEKNSTISKNNRCEISEKVLTKSILLMDSTSQVSTEDIEIQINALKILTENKWTRASNIAISYFRLAKVMFVNNIISEEQFITTISSLSSVAPIDSVSELTIYLEELNSQKEKGNQISVNLVLSVINTLGAIGDKSAFDSLLAVTYLNYDESVLTAAREALSGLRW